MSDFSDIIYKNLKRLGISQAALGERVCATASYVNQILKGTCAPISPDRLPMWADALGLSGVERDEFLHLGILAHAPDAVRQEIERMRSELAAALQGKADLLAKLDRSSADVERGEAELIRLRSQAAELLAENARLAAKLKQVGHD